MACSRADCVSSPIPPPHCPPARPCGRAARRASSWLSDPKGAGTISNSDCSTRMAFAGSIWARARHGVGEEAQCPTRGACWTRGTGPCMILGVVRARASGYWPVPQGRPPPADAAEPARVADAVHTLGLNYVVITSVDRDDLAD